MIDILKAKEEFKKFVKNYDATHTRIKVQEFVKKYIDEKIK